MSPIFGIGGPEIMIFAIDHFAKVIPDLLAVQTRLNHFLRFAGYPFMGESVSHLT
jgi:hypothetical protein